MKRGRDEPPKPNGKDAGAGSGEVKKVPGRKHSYAKTQIVDATLLPTQATQVKKRRPVSRIPSGDPSAAHPQPHHQPQPHSQTGRGRAVGGQGSSQGSFEPYDGPALPPAAESRLERGVICGSLWSEGGKAPAEDEMTPVPATFGSFEEYISAMEPLLIEEAREGARSGFSESCAGGRRLAADIMSVQEMPGTEPGWHNVTVRFHEPPRRDTLRDGSLLVLMDKCPPRTRDMAEWVDRELRASEGRMRTQASLEESQRLTSDREGWGRGRSRGDRGRGGPQQQPQQHDLAIAMGVVRSGPGGNDRKVAEQRVEIHPGPLQPNWVDPAQAMAAVPQSWWVVSASDLITVRREIEALRGLEDSSVSEEILNPESMAKKKSEQKGEQFWPHEVAQEGYHQFLNRKYDFSQLKAIEEASAHLTHPSFGGVGPADAAWLPFTLIQGPPGTGKTHTVRGILNTWHLVQYQRYYTSLVACLAPRSTIAKEWRKAHRLSSAGRGMQDVFAGHLNPNQLDERLMFLPGVQPRPRVLVCAPSNAATDELLQRIMNDGFRAANGSIYRPNVVRVGSGAAPLSQRARDVWVDGMVKQYLSATDTNSVVVALEEKKREMAHHQHMLQVKGNLAMRDGVEVDALAQELAQIYDAWYKARQEVVRMHFVLDHMRTGHRSHAMDLELELVEHAEIIFTTLSSSGRNIFSRLKDRKYMRIETVLIDEACQACEVAALQPLMYGCRKCVLVGDPQQLPATVLSMKAKARQMERSLFERLQQGRSPVHMLMVQYRMHPEIRQFPSNHFYEGMLQDGECVLTKPDPAFYEADLLKPYIFFDVSAGREQRTGGKSVSNQEEADLACALYVELLHTLEDLKSVTPVSVGVITPYRDQRDCLQRTFRKVCGDKASEVFIETVDSFQGRQLDVVMLSCVRASSSKSKVGFVGDIRRMNVAITRAQSAMWVLGDAATLRSSYEWHSLIEDASSRQRVVANASARGLFPHQFGSGNGQGPHRMERLPPPSAPEPYYQQPSLQQRQQHPEGDPAGAAMAAWGGYQPPSPLPGRQDPREAVSAAQGRHQPPPQQQQLTMGHPDPRTAAMEAWGAHPADPRQVGSQGIHHPQAVQQQSRGGGALPGRTHQNGGDPFAAHTSGMDMWSSGHGAMRSSGVVNQAQGDTNCDDEDTELSLSGLVLNSGAVARNGDGLAAALAWKAIQSQQLRAPSLTDLMQDDSAPAVPKASSPEEGPPHADMAELRQQIVSYEERCKKQEETETFLKREMQRLQGEMGHVKKDRDMMYFAWHKAKAENAALTTQLSDLKGQQHKTAMKANNKNNNLQCKIDSLVYLSQEAEKKHKAELAELRAQLEAAMEVSGGSRASGNTAGTAHPISV